MPEEVLLYTPQIPSPDAVTIGWAYPYSYGVSMSSLGYMTLFR